MAIPLEELKGILESCGWLVQEGTFSVPTTDIQDMGGNTFKSIPAGPMTLSLELVAMDSEVAISPGDTVAKKEEPEEEGLTVGELFQRIRMVIAGELEEALAKPVPMDHFEPGSLGRMIEEAHEALHSPKTVTTTGFAFNSDPVAKGPKVTVPDPGQTPLDAIQGLEASTPILMAEDGTPLTALEALNKAKKEAGK